MVARLHRTHKTLFCKKKCISFAPRKEIQFILGPRIPGTGFQSLAVSGTWIVDCNR